MIKTKITNVWMGVIVLTLALALSGCSVIPNAGDAMAAPAAAAVIATPAPSPTPVVVSTPSSKDAAASGATRRLATTNMTYNGEILAETIVPVVAQVGGQIEEVKVKVGDPVRKGYLLARIDSAAFEAQRAQAQAALYLAQAQL